MSKTEKIELTKILVAVQVAIIVIIGLIVLIDTKPLLIVPIALFGSTVLMGLESDDENEVSEEEI